MIAMAIAASSPTDATSYVLVTGGLGYIGSHTVIQLLSKNYEVVILDNLSNSNRTVIDRIHQIAKKTPIFCEGDIRDINFLKEVFDGYKISSVIHFAGLKDVSQSLKNPIEYFSNNVSGSISLF